MQFRRLTGNIIKEIRRLQHQRSNYLFKETNMKVSRANNNRQQRNTLMVEWYRIACIFLRIWQGRNNRRGCKRFTIGHRRIKKIRNMVLERKCRVCNPWCGRVESYFHWCDSGSTIDSHERLFCYAKEDTRRPKKRPIRLQHSPDVTTIIPENKRFCLLEKAIVPKVHSEVCNASGFRSLNEGGFMLWFNIAIFCVVICL